MIFEGTVSFAFTDDKGNEKKKRESVIIDGLDTFTEVETRLYNQYDGESELEVTAIRRSRIREIANKRAEGRTTIFIAELCDTFTDDKGNEKDNIYKIAFFAGSIEGAKTFIDDYMKQGYDMRLKSLTETKFADVI